MPAFENMAQKMLCAGRGAVVGAGEVNKKNGGKLPRAKNAVLRELVTMMKAHGFSLSVPGGRP